MRAVGMILAEGLNDPRVTGLITVTGVSVSEDLRDATVRVSILPDTRQVTVLAGLRHAARHIQRRIDQELRVRQVPSIHFSLDTAVKKEGSVLAAIRQAVDEDDRRRASAPPPAEPEDAP